jgi:hypothetical protein
MGRHWTHAVGTAVLLAGWSPAAAQVSVADQHGDIVILFGIAPGGAPPNGPLKVTLRSGSSDAPGNLVMIGPACEVALASGTIAVHTPIAHATQLPRTVGADEGMRRIAAFAQSVGFTLTDKERDCGRELLDQARHGGSRLSLAYGGTGG